MKISFALKRGILFGLIFFAFSVLHHSIILSRHKTTHVIVGPNNHIKEEGKPSKFHVEPGPVSRFHEWLDNIANSIIDRFIPFKKAMEQEWSLFYRLLFSFLAGFLVGLTPCVYPMIPITAGILQTQASVSIAYNFLLSLAYVFGIAIIFSLLGYIAATTTVVFGQWLTNPLFVGFTIFFFLYFAFSMFGFYEIYIPKFLRRGPELQVKGSLFYNFIMGILSGSVASTCATPALLIMLGYVAKIGSPLQGFLLLFVYTFGFSILLILVGTFSSSLALLPRAGAWMVEIKKIFGFLMLGISIYIIEPLISSNFANVLYGLLLVSTSLYYLIKSISSRPLHKIKFAVGLILLIVALLLLA